MTNLATRRNSLGSTSALHAMQVAPDMSRLCELRNHHKDEVLSFLAERPVHTVVMTSFINDNGLESDLNRGEFYGYRDTKGKLTGVALIGHSTLVEARSFDAMQALAITARKSSTPIHLIMSDGKAAETFWKLYSGNLSEPRLSCVEELFELGLPFLVRKCSWEVRFATLEEL